MCLRFWCNQSQFAVAGLRADLLCEGRMKSELATWIGMEAMPGPCSWLSIQDVGATYSHCDRQQIWLCHAHAAIIFLVSVAFLVFQSSEIRLASGSQ